MLYTGTPCFAGQCALWLERKTRKPPPRARVQCLHVEDDYISHESCHTRVWIDRLLGGRLLTSSFGCSALGRRRRKLVYKGCAGG